MQKEEVAGDFSRHAETMWLTGIQRSWRAGVAAAMAAGLLLLKFVNPAEGGFSFSTPVIQRLFGLPCPFCGMTRGTHALLNGEVMQALYLNLATGLVVACALMLVGVWVVEAIRGRTLAWFMPMVNAVFRRWKLLASFLVLFWLVHLSMALVQPKRELLDREAPFFPEFLLEAVSKK